MDETIRQEFRGFDETALRQSLILRWIYASAAEKFEWNINTSTSTPNQRSNFNNMEFSLMNCFEEATNVPQCSNVSFKGYVIDNDSGYVSQNIESNSSTEVSMENRPILLEGLNVRNVYVNEDTLLEQPQILMNQYAENHEEFGHQFHIKDDVSNVLNSSVVSQNTTFSGLEGDDSDISDVSGTIPVATPIIISSHLITGSNANSNGLCSGNDSFLPCNTNDSVQLEPHCSQNVQNNFANNTTSKFDEISHESEVKEKLNSTFEENRNNLSSIQSRIMDAHNCDMSLFESFYTFVCDLYTRNDMTSIDLANASIDPRHLQLNNISGTNRNELTNSKSPNKVSYVELQSKHVTNSSGNDNITNSCINSELSGSQQQQQNCVIKESTNKSVQNKEVAPEAPDKLINLNPPATPTKQFKNPIVPEMSPELFSDEEPPEFLSQSFTQIYKKCEKMYVLKNDRLLLKRAQESLCGVLPPPSVTVNRLSIDEMLQKIKDNQTSFMISGNDSSEKIESNGEMVSNHNLMEETAKKRQSVLLTCTKEDCAATEWPNIIQCRYHGLHHNRSKISEDFERLCLKYAERYVGAETQSSCTVFGIEIASPSKRKFKLKRPGKSPGKRLSHLARRRITFSKDSLHSTVGPSSCSFIGARTRQIMVDARKMELLSRRRSPKKRTPGKSPRKRQTPSSSAKKRFEMRLRMYGSENADANPSVASTSNSRASATKRALFQSPPEKGENTRGLLQLLGADPPTSESTQRKSPRRALFPSPFKASPSKSGISSLYPAKRKLTPKRALFASPIKNSPSKLGGTGDNKKRKRTDAEDAEQPKKFSRSTSMGLSNSTGTSSRIFTRSHSSSSFGSVQSQDIAEHRKKKLMWTVAEALRSQNIDLKHPQFKVFASVLARVIRHFLPNLFTNGPRPEGSTTESMLRIARQHVFAVTRGKTVDQIIKEAQKNMVRIPKPSGYIGLDKSETTTDSVCNTKNKENILQDKANIIDNSENARSNKTRHGENIERIRRVINFGDEGDNRNNSAVR